jgi:hypothetical protein
VSHGAPRGLPSNARTAFYALLAVLASLDLLILGVRFAAALRGGDIRLLSEGTSLYSIWKLRHGYPLYESPLSPPFNVTYYNFLFYGVYAAVFSALRTADAATPIVGRFVTLALCAGGGVLQYAAGRRLLRGLPVARWLPFLMATITWTGGVLPGVWAYTTRPDIGATVMALAGMYMALRAFGGDGRVWLVAAGGAFFGAWAFKQSNVGMFVATLAYAIVWRRSGREVAALAIPWVLGAVVTFAMGGAAYRENIVFVPSVNPLIPSAALYWYGSALFTNALIWSAAIAAIVLFAARGPSMFTQDGDITYLVVVTVCCFAIDTVLLMKVGSALNHILDLSCAAALVATAVLGGLVRRDALRPLLLLAASAALLPMLGSDVARFAREKPALLAAIQDTDPLTAERRTIARAVGSLPKPLYTEDEVFALPWFSSGNTYPAVMRDPTFHDVAQSKGLIGAGIDGLIAEQRFAAILLPESSPRLSVALASGYQQASVPLPASAGLRALIRPPRSR